MSENRQKGSGLVLAITVLFLLSGIGVALLFLSQTELKLSRANSDAKRAFQFAESGLEDGRMTLWDTNGDGPFSDDLATAAGADGVIDFDPDAVQAAFDAEGFATALSGFDDDVPLRGLVALGNSATSGRYAAFLTNDPQEGEFTTIDLNGRVMITGVGYGRRRSAEIVRAIVEPYKPIFEAPPAAITLLGPSPQFDNGNSNTQAHNGNDCGGSGVPGLYAPIVGAVDPSGAQDIKDDMKRPEAFSSGPFTGEDTVADLTDPTDPVLAGSGLGTIDPGWMNCRSLRAMVIELIAGADYYCNTDVSSCTIPATGPDDIIVIDGDYATVGNITRTGILLVTGVLTWQGNSDWDGLVLAIGEGHVIRSGGGNGKPSGGLVVANIDPSHGGPYAYKSDWCTGSADGFLSAEYDTTGGGTSEVDYCSQDLNAANTNRTLKVVEFLQR